MDDAGSGELRGKYLDWCSARVAERFLELSPEEIYELARPAGGGSAPAADGFPIPGPDDESYRVLVQRATEALLSRMTLPGFREWSRLYERSPERYDAEMLGFWKGLSGGGA